MANRSDTILSKIKDKRLHTPYITGRNQSRVDKKSSKAWLGKTETSTKNSKQVTGLSILDDIPEYNPW